MKKHKLRIGTRFVGCLAGICLSLFVWGCSGAMMDMVKKQTPLAPAPSPPAAPASGSLWPGENYRNMLFTDMKARRVNDIVTVVVSESTDGSSKAGTNTSRNASATAGITALFGLEKSLQERNENLLPKMQAGGATSNSIKGLGDTNRTSKLTTRLTARVTKVLDNGNLFIEGRRQLTMNGEDQYIVISGIIRPMDISADNLISSQSIADAKIYYVGEGVINDKIQPGWLTHIMNRIWPF